MKQIRIIARILVGLVFIFSGFVKGIDPMGSAIKFSEYFETFHLTWLSSFALVLSIAQSTAEFLIGVALLVGLRMRVTAWATLIFMGFFLVLTFYIAIANPVTDCGCFGDALVITNWQTFYKNIVLMALA
ncbi:MAG TPA: MauE/DoxX family redox-associated membrane protein, partial [Bacteroidales bacterium]